ncbi:MAG: hypothetical protein FJ029_11210 [Actinobacteria bacterium]|nr:hypothetical protein [Actinomycetota bacterium]
MWAPNAIRGWAGFVAASYVAAAALSGVFAVHYVSDHDIANFESKAEFLARKGFSTAAYDPRSAAEVAGALRAEGATARPLTTPSTFVRHYDRLSGLVQSLFPLGGAPMADVVTCNELGRFARYQLDRLGFVNADSVHDQGGPAVVVLGDSFAQGSCVPLEATVAARMRAVGIRAVSMGLSSSGPLIELGILNEYAEAVSARVIFWFVYEGNDLENLVGELQVPLLAGYLAGSRQGLMGRQAEVERFWTTLPPIDPTSPPVSPSARSRQAAFVAKELATFYYLRLPFGLHATLLENREPANRALREIERVLATGRDTIESLGAQVEFVFLPSYDSFRKGNFREYGYIDHVGKDALLQAMARVGDVINFETIMRANAADPLEYFPFREAGTHYTPDGYALLAHTLSEWLRVNRPDLGPGRR